MSLDIGRQIAQEILKSQSRTSIIGQPPEQAGFKEHPRPLSYYYTPHQYQTIEAGDTVTLFDFVVPGSHVLHVHQVANNWYEDTYSEWKVDGARFEKVERWISSINTPLVIKDRFVCAYKNVKWITFNKSDGSILSEVLIDGIVYHLDDWKKIVPTSSA